MLQGKLITSIKPTLSAMQFIANKGDVKKFKIVKVCFLRLALTIFSIANATLISISTSDGLVTAGKDNQGWWGLALLNADSNIATIFHVNSSLFIFSIFSTLPVLSFNKFEVITLGRMCPVMGRNNLSNKETSNEI
jgi:hypothetical protein